MLQIIEAVDGPIVNQLYLTEEAHGEKFSVLAEKAYTKAIAETKSAFEKTKLSDLIEG